MAAASGVSGIYGLSPVYFQHRFAILFYSLLVTMVVAPLSGTLGLNAGLVELFLAANLLVTVMPIDAKRSRRIVLGIWRSCG